MNNNALSFYASSDIDRFFSIKINSLEGKKPLLKASELIENPDLQLIASNTDPISILYVTIQIFSDSKPLTPINYSLTRLFRNSRKWNEWITLPIKYSELLFDSQLAITVWEQAGPNKKIPFGGTTVRLFDENDCTFKRGSQKLKLWLNKEADGLSNTTTPSFFNSNDEMNRIEKLIKRHETGEIMRVDWLDNLVFRKIEQINRDLIINNNNDNINNSNKDNNGSHFLFVEFAQFDFTVVFSDYRYPKIEMKHGNLQPNYEEEEEEEEPLVTIYDPESQSVVDPNLNSNIIEAKHHLMVRGSRYRPLDRELMPNPKIRDELNTIMKFSPTQKLSGDEKNLLWDFRYYLTRDKRALTKFLKSVSWNNLTEVKQVNQLLPKWTEIEIDDALELLGPQFLNKSVRSYAVNRLKKANDDEIELYLLQLVQALKYENIDVSNPSNCLKSSLVKFLINRAVNNPKLGNYLYWYLRVESMDKTNENKLFANISTQFLTELDGHNLLNELIREREFIGKISNISQSIQNSKESRLKKIEKIRKYIADPKNNLQSFSPLTLPIDPYVTIIGIKSDDATIFKSSLSPLRLNLFTNKHISKNDDDEPQMFPIIFKHGDDLRQDQLVIQILTLMDKLLRKENLDLKLTPYKILATGPIEGIVQYIPSISLAAAISDYHGISEYLKHFNPDDNDPLGIKPEIMDNFVKSVAGYCVFTYLLGVGDRHLDNLMISPDGHFFHIDFGYILGRDPKPFPPLMKLPVQVVEAMGDPNMPGMWQQSENFQRMKNYCFTAYMTLRKSANLILNLFALMEHANITDIRLDPDKAVLKVKEKFCLEMSEEEAVAHFENLINSSVSAFFPMVIDRLHNFAQYWRT